MSENTATAADVIELRQNIQDLLRRRVLEVVQAVLEEELSEALGTERYERSTTRQGYRNGHESRRITTSVGTREFEVPRARIVKEDGGSEEFRSEILPRYQRRTCEVDEASPGCVPGWGEYATDSQGPGAAHRERTPLEERGVQGGLAAQGLLR